MVRIKIEDLPSDENLTPEELAELEGAGRPSFRPMIESLEARQLMAANLASLAPGLLGPGLVHQAPVNEIQMVVLGPTAAPHAQGAGHTAAASPALDAALTGFGGGGGGSREGQGRGTLREFNAILAGQQKMAPGQEMTFDLGRGYTATISMSKGDYPVREVQIFAPAARGSDRGPRVFHGTEDAAGRFSVESTVPGAVDGTVYTTFNKYGGRWNADTNAWAPDTSQTLLTRQISKGAAVVSVNGGWQEIKGQLRWVESTGSRDSYQRVEVYEGFGTNGLGDKSLSVTEYSKGKLSRVQENRADGTTVVESYTDGIRTRLYTRTADGHEVVDSFDTAGHKTRHETRTPDGHQVWDTLDTAGRGTKHETRTPDGHQVWELLDTAGHVTWRETRTPDGHTVVDTLDTAGHVTRRETRTPTGTVEVFTYDANGRETSHQTIPPPKS